MPLKYILIIIGASVFVILLVLYVILAVRKHKRDVLLRSEIEKMYADKNLATMDYDCAVYDEETEKLIREKQTTDGQMTIDDVMISAVAAAVDENVFQTVEKEGLEEITGNYKPE